MQLDEASNHKCVGDADTQYFSLSLEWVINLSQLGKVLHWPFETGLPYRAKHTQVIANSSC